jgi:hypothetical protein
MRFKLNCSHICRSLLVRQFFLRRNAFGLSFSRCANNEGVKIRSLHLVFPKLLNIFRWFFGIVNIFWTSKFRYFWRWYVTKRIIVIVSRDSVVGIATRYGLGGSEIEPQLGEIFRTRPDRPWGPPSFLHNGYRVFPGCKAAGAWGWPPTPFSAEVKEILDLYLYSPSGPSWPVLGWTLPLLLLLLLLLLLVTFSKLFGFC